MVELKSFSQAAERLGVTQPAVSLQVRSLEKRLDRKLLDRSGRRVEPTEAGLALYRGAQRMLQLEEQLVEELDEGEGGELGGTLAVGASTGPGSTVVPVLLCEFQREQPGRRGLALDLGHPDASSSASRSASSSLGSSARRGATAASSSSRSSATRSCSRSRPATVSPDRTVTLDQLREEPLIVMQEGAGVRQVIEDELRSAGTRLSELEPRLELGLQESVKAAVVAGFGVTFISRAAIEADLAAGTLATARVKGLDPAREISLVRSAGRSPTRAAEAFLAFARERL